MKTLAGLITLLAALAAARAAPTNVVLSALMVDPGNVVTSPCSRAAFLEANGIPAAASFDALEAGLLAAQTTQAEHTVALAILGTGKVEQVAFDGYTNVLADALAEKLGQAAFAAHTNAADPHTQYTENPAALSNFTWTVAGGEVEITGYTVGDLSVRVPDYIDGLPVTEIGTVFKYNIDITDCIIGRNVRRLDDKAFQSCLSLETVFVPAGVKEIGDDAFADCRKLASAQIEEGVTNIASRAFRYCTALPRITIPASVRKLGANAFSYCTNLNSVTFLGNAPTSLPGSFTYGVPGVGYFYSGASGFTPAWAVTADLPIEAIGAGAGDGSAFSNIGTGNLSAAAHALYLNTPESDPVAATGKADVVHTHAWTDLTDGGTVSQQLVTAADAAAAARDVALSNNVLSVAARQDASLSNSLVAVAAGMTNAVEQEISGRGYLTAETDPLWSAWRTNALAGATNAILADGTLVDVGTLLSATGSGGGLTNEADTLATVTTRGATTPTAIIVSNDLTVGTGHFVYSPLFRSYSGSSWGSPVCWTTAQYRYEFGMCPEMQAFVFNPVAAATNSAAHLPLVIVATPGKRTKYGRYSEALRVETNGNVTLGGRLDMGGYSITNIGNNSLTFKDGTHISSRDWRATTGPRRRAEGPLAALALYLAGWAGGKRKRLLEWVKRLGGRLGFWALLVALALSGRAAEAQGPGINSNAVAAWNAALVRPIPTNVWLASWQRRVYQGKLRFGTTLDSNTLVDVQYQAEAGECVFALYSKPTTGLVSAASVLLGNLTARSTNQVAALAGGVAAGQDLYLSITNTVTGCTGLTVRVRGWVAP